MQYVTFKFHDHKIRDPMDYARNVRDHVNKAIPGAISNSKENGGYSGKGNESFNLHVNHKKHVAAVIDHVKKHFGNEHIHTGSSYKMYSSHKTYSVEGSTMSLFKHLSEAAKVHPMAVHAYPIGGGKFKVHATGSDVKHVKAGETVSSSDLDDLTDAGHKVKEIKKPA